MTTWTVPEPRARADLTMADGAVIRLRCHGNPDGVRLVLSHGNGFAIDGYLPFWQPLLDRFEIVVFDLRNHGKNPLAGGEGHDYAHFVYDLDAIGRALPGLFGPRPTVGVFHSSSAITALAHALWLRAPWDALVLFDPPIVPPAFHPLGAEAREWEGIISGWTAKRRDAFDDPSVLAGQFARSPMHRLWPEGAHELMARATLRRDEAAGLWRLCCPKELEARIYGANAELPLWPAPGDLGCPAIIIAADPDRPEPQMPSRSNRALHEATGFPYRAIPGTGHMLQIERVAECHTAMFAFLDEARVRAGSV